MHKIVEDVGNGEGCDVGEQEVYVKSLDFPLNSAVNLKLL